VEVTLRRMILLALPLLALAGCGGSDDDTQSEKPTTAQGTNLAAIKSYLLAHTERLKTDSAAQKANADAYYALAGSVGFDYDRLLKEKGPQAKQLVTQGQRLFAKANPAYEEMEGVVAGVPSLADYDVIIDAGGDASDPENAVPFDVKTKAGKVYKQPGNYNYLIETSLFGTEPKFAAKGVKPDLDGDGRVEFGEALPDADFYQAAASGFADQSAELDASARTWQPTLQDALTALVVMTPTMSEYFEAWKNSRFISGDKASEKAFVVASRLQDIEDILGGLVLVYDNVETSIAKTDPAQARQTGSSLVKLRDFAGDLHKQETGGKKFTPDDADTLGGDAQDRAENIAGQISQAAGQLNIKLET
jgi:hypothetical protein